MTRRYSQPFGEDRGAKPANWTGEKGFVGGTKDPTGLTHLGAREYDANTGRFISADPVMDLKDPQQVNGYAYSNNNPVTFADSDGRFLWALVAVIVANFVVEVTATQNNQSSTTTSSSSGSGSSPSGTGSYGSASSGSALAATKAAVPDTPPCALGAGVASPPTRALWGA